MDTKDPFFGRDEDKSRSEGHLRGAQPERDTLRPIDDWLKIGEQLGNHSLDHWDEPRLNSQNTSRSLNKVLRSTWNILICLSQPVSYAFLDESESYRDGESDEDFWREAHRSEQR